jgi:mannose-6-phosphate isomerase
VTPSHVYRLTNKLRTYAWGSSTAIPELLGVPGDGGPVAEMWLGAHELGPSLTVPGEESGASGSSGGRDGQGASGQGQALGDHGAPGQHGVPLSTLIRSDPDRLLGRAVVEEFGPRLPYLLKVLAAAEPLSLQVHPKPHVARAGFSRENAAGVALTDPARNFKDDQHKPEMIVALTPFEALCGFRRPDQTLSLLDGLDGEYVARMRAALAATPTADGVHQAFAIALSARDEDCAEDLYRTVSSIRGRVACGDSNSRADRTAINLAEHYPGDPGALVSLMLNRVSLRPGDAVFLGAGEVHAYLSGVGIEVMASSDNVLRAGLTSKRVDTEALMACASYAPKPPEHPVLRSEPGGLTAYRVPVSEFSLLVGSVAGHARIAHTGPRILLCLEGEIELSGAMGSLGFVRQGQSVFLAHDAGHVALDGAGTVVVAYVP